MPHKHIGYIGLGKMGSNMAVRLLGHGWGVVAHDPNSEAVKGVLEKGAIAAVSAENTAEQLKSPRLVWIMVPNKAVESVLEEITPVLGEGDVVIDGGNTFYKDSMARAEKLSQKGIRFLDVGVSGGPSGARDGACMMVGGEKEVYEKYEQLFEDLCVPEGYGHMGKNGAGHFVKMVHNGIEYGMMQAIAEGFAVMKQSDFGLSLTDVAHVYNHGSVITSRLIGWIEEGYKEFGEDLAEVSGAVAATGEGEWTVNAGEELGVPTPIIKGALDFRTESQENPSYTGKVLSTLRNMFGGHNIDKR